MEIVLFIIIFYMIFIVIKILILYINIKKKKILVIQKIGSIYFCVNKTQISFLKLYCLNQFNLALLLYSLKSLENIFLIRMNNFFTLNKNVYIAFKNYKKQVDVSSDCTGNFKINQKFIFFFTKINFYKHFCMLTNYFCLFSEVDSVNLFFCKKSFDFKITNSILEEFSKTEKFSCKIFYFTNNITVKKKFKWKIL